MSVEYRWNAYNIYVHAEQSPRMVVAENIKRAIEEYCKQFEDSVDNVTKVEKSIEAVIVQTRK